MVADKRRASASTQHVQVPGKCWYNLSLLRMATEFRGRIEHGPNGPFLCSHVVARRAAAVHSSALLLHAQLTDIWSCQRTYCHSAASCLEARTFC